MRFSERLKSLFPPKMLILENWSVSMKVFTLIDSANPCAKNWWVEGLLLLVAIMTAALANSYQAPAICLLLY